MTFGITPQRAKPFDFNVQLRPEEREWWRKLENARQNLKTAGEELDEALKSGEIRPGKEPNYYSRAEALKTAPKATLDNFKAAREQFQTILRDGVIKEYRTPLESSKVQLVWIPRPVYTREGVENKICGVVTVRVSIEKTGEFGAIGVVNSYTVQCLPAVGLPPIGVPNPPRDEVPYRLGHGLDEAALEAVKEAIFLPAIRDYRPISTKIRLEVNFNQKI